MLKHDRPVLFIEISKAHNPLYQTLLQLLEAARYRAYTISRNGLNENAQQAIESQPTFLGGDTPHANSQFDFLFFPIELAPQLSNLVTR